MPRSNGQKSACKRLRMAPHANSLFKKPARGELVCNEHTLLFAPNCKQEQNQRNNGDKLQITRYPQTNSHKQKFLPKPTGISEAVNGEPKPCRQTGNQDRDYCPKQLSTEVFHFSSLPFCLCRRLILVQLRSAIIVPVAPVIPVSQKSSQSINFPILIEGFEHCLSSNRTTDKHLR